MKICITSIGTATSVNAIKAIKNNYSDIHIVGTDTNEYGYTAASLMVNFFYRLPYAQDIDYIMELYNLIKRENIDFLLPINDEEIKKIACNIQKFSQICKIVIPELSVIELVQDKLKASKYMTNIGILCPDLVDINFNDKRIIRERHGVGSKGILVLDCDQKIQRNKFKNMKETFVQKFISGMEYTVDVLSDEEGNPLYIIPRRRLEVKAGVATKVEIVYNPLLIEYVQCILKNIKLPGFSNIQFICDELGKYWFVEINPRLGGFTSSSMMASRIFQDFIDCFVLRNKTFDQETIGNIYHNNMKQVKWGSIITRYYEEVLYDPEQ